MSGPGAIDIFAAFAIFVVEFIFKKLYSNLDLAAG